jgi:hypothetical protein
MGLSDSLPKPSFPYAPFTSLAAGRGPPSPDAATGQHQTPISAAMNWSSDAATSLKEIPFVVRPIIRRRIESMAREAGLDGVDLAFYEQAKERFGRK